MYQPLPENTIRVLYLRPGIGTDPLQCHLTHVNLDDKPHFEAVSYLWGSASDQNQIAIESFAERVVITESAAQALRRLRHATETRRLWMDQICINQKDIAERSQQVGIMHRILSGARCVLMYLGDDSEHLAAFAKDFLEELQDRWQTPAKAYYDDIKTMEHENFPTPDSKSWTAFRTLLGLQ